MLGFILIVFTFCLRSICFTDGKMFNRGVNFYSNQSFSFVPTRQVYPSLAWPSNVCFSSPIGYDLVVPSTSTSFIARQNAHRKSINRYGHWHGVCKFPDSMDCILYQCALDVACIRRANWSMLSIAFFVLGDFFRE